MGPLPPMIQNPPLAGFEFKSFGIAKTLLCRTAIQSNGFLRPYALILEGKSKNWTFLGLQISAKWFESKSLFNNEFENKSTSCVH